MARKRLEDHGVPAKGSMEPRARQTVQPAIGIAKTGK
jgi:hypothetical protein